MSATESTRVNVLVIVLLFLFSPVLVELVDFHSGVALLYQVKGLRGTKNAFQVTNRTNAHVQEFPWACVSAFTL